MNGNGGNGSLLSLLKKIGLCVGLKIIFRPMGMLDLVV
jgi:hypothetical protein